MAKLHNIYSKIKSIAQNTGGGYACALIVSITLSSKTCVIEDYQSTSPLGKILELASAQFCGNLIIFTVLFAFLAHTFGSAFRKNQDKYRINILAVVFAGFFIIGRSFAAYNSLTFIFGDLYLFGFALLYLCGYSLLFNFIINYLLNLIENNAASEKNIYELKIDKKLILLFLVCWTPYLLAFYPGSVPHDGYYQLNMFYGINQPSNHHPWFATLVMGSIHWIGKNISDNFGIFLFVLIQSVFGAFVFFLICKKISNYNISKKVKVAVILFYAVVPIWGSYAQAFIKDTVYYALFALFMLYYIEIIENRSLLGRKQMSIFLVISCAMGLFRNEAIYILILSFLSLIIVSAKKNCGKIIVSLALILTVNIGFEKMTFPVFDVQKEESIKEMLNISFQQTARYVIKHEDDLTEEDRETINQVLSYERIKNNYNPTISNPVQNAYRNPSKQHLLEYFKLCFQQLLKDPACYIEAALNHCYGYFYPEYICKDMVAMQFYIKGEPVATGDLDIFYENSEEVRGIISRYSNLWIKVPILSLLMNPASYTWTLFFVLMLLLRNKKWKDLIASVPLFLALGVCVISRVNGYIRYMLPVIVATPLLLTFSLNLVKKDVRSRKS